MSHSFAQKINRATVLKAVRTGTISGTDMRRCANQVADLLGAHPACGRKVYELLLTLERDNTIVLRDAVLRVTTHEERTQLRKEATEASRRARARKHRAEEVRAGGLHAVPPLAPVIDMGLIGYKNWVERSLGVKPVPVSTTVLALV
ncbi:MAG TPA: hypothetical protein VL362_00190 [Patescibacteria group bacterium]|nr:hypothetical protein [Patescibacteria group bacterium]